MSALDEALQRLITELGRSDLLIITEAKKELVALRKAAQQSAAHPTVAGAGERGSNSLQSSFIADDPSAKNGGR